MKNFIFILSILGFLSLNSNSLNAQKILKGAEKSYDTGMSAYKKEKYKDASGSLIIAIDNIPENVDSRKYQLARLEAASTLVDIHFNHDEDLTKACKYLDIFTRDLNRMKKANNLKAKDIYKYLELEKDYSKYINQCERFRSIDSNKKDFEKIFDEQFDE